MKNKKMLSKLILITLVSCLSFCFSMNAWCAKPWENKIQLTSDGLYVAKIKNQNLWLVMERVDNNNIDSWKRYATVQKDLRVTTFASKFEKKFNDVGSQHFYKVLHEVPRDKNEVWVAYITSDLNAKSTDISYCYNADVLEEYYKAIYSAKQQTAFKPTKFNEHLKMFFTVTSSPNALVTSHMGISASAEGSISGRPKGISVDLHSFAAKVMLIRNPDRKYMINAPAFAMEKIMVDSLPKDAVFVGTREMKKTIEDRQSTSLDDFKHSIADINMQSMINEANMACQILNQSLDKDVNKLLQYAQNYSLVERSKDGTFVISESKKASIKERMIQNEFNYFKNPYAYYDDSHTATSQKFP